MIQTLRSLLRLIVGPLASRSSRHSDNRHSTLMILDHVVHGSRNTVGANVNRDGFRPGVNIVSEINYAVENQVNESADVVRLLRAAGARVNLLPPLSIRAIRELDFFAARGIARRDRRRIVIAEPTDCRTRAAGHVAIGIIVDKQKGNSTVRVQAAVTVGRSHSYLS